MTGDPRWVVSVAFVVDERPVAGVVYAPALDEFYAAARGHGATLNGAALPPRRLAAARRRWPQADHRGDGGGSWCPIEIVPRVPALAYRMCLAARGLIDFAVSAENSHDWDIAASDLLLEESGARLVDASGERLRYNSRQVRRGALLAASDFGAPRLIKGFRAAPPRRQADGRRLPGACVFAAARAKGQLPWPRAPRVFKEM